jgi:hypothetical protein
VQALSCYFISPQITDISQSKQKGIVYMEKFNVKKIENAILTDCPDDAIQEVIETADIPIYGQLLLDVNNNDSFLHFSFRARDCNIVYSFDVIGFTISPVAENDETEYSFETSDGTYTFVCKD